jgi:hypothetical protein
MPIGNFSMPIWCINNLDDGGRAKERYHGYVINSILTFSFYLTISSHIVVELSWVRIRSFSSNTDPAIEPGYFVT